MKNINDFLSNLIFINIFLDLNAYNEYLTNNTLT